MMKFLETDPKTIFSSLKNRFESISNRVLYPAQVENLLLRVAAYSTSILRNSIQHSAEQNLVAYAIDDHLDALGVMMDTPRLQPTAAECRVQFILETPTQPGRSFPAGTRITTEDGKIVFETLDTAYIITHNTASSIVSARCITTGTAANGLDTGVLCVIDPAIDGVSVANTTPTWGGGNLENDTAYRERLALAPARFGCGGSKAAYRYWALSASSLVADALASPSKSNDGNIEICILAKDNDVEIEATQELCSIVQEFCNCDTVRLINDYVHVSPARAEHYSIKAEITVYDTHDAAIVLDKVRALAAEYTLRQKAKLGLDVTPTQVLLALKTDGLYKVDLIEPADIVIIDDTKFAYCDVIDIELAYENGGLVHD
jgi:phage-related baseplate assembly protein